MEIDEATHGAVLVLRPQGRLDSSGAPRFEQRVRERLADGQRRLVIDLGALDYVSSAGLRILLVAARSLKAEGGALVLCGATDTVMEILRVSAFDRIFTILPTVAQSVDQLG
jgi:anti-anti-sigma factor